MNLFTAQQHCPPEAEAIADIINQRDPIVVHVPEIERMHDEKGRLVGTKVVEGHDTFWTDRYGEVQGCITKTHDCGRYRPCVHAIETPRRCALFGSDWVLHLGWQPTLVGNRYIAARRSDIVVVGFDVVGPMDMCENRPTVLPDINRWTYRMFPLIFDDRPDEVFPRAWLGIWND